MDLAKKTGEGERKILHRDSFSVSQRQRDIFTVLAFEGTFKDIHLPELRRALAPLHEPTAIESASLQGITISLVREIYTFYRRIEGLGKTCILIRPADKIREYLSLIAPGFAVKSVLSEQDLVDSTQDLSNLLSKAEKTLAEIHRELSYNPVWRYVDRQSCWLCPYCGAIQEETKVISLINIPRGVVERIYHHLRNDCQPYRGGAGKLLPVATLDSTLQRVNQAKYEASRERAKVLETRVRKLEKEVQSSEALKSSLAYAAQRQQRLLPTRPPEFPGASFAICYKPSERLSGDFYDFVHLDNGDLAIVLGDVTGHGIEAGILMGMAKKVIQLRCRETRGPSDALKMANRDIFPDLDRQTFVTAFVARYTPSTKVLRYGRAGHNPPILYNPEREPQTSYLDTKGSALGIDGGPRFDAILGEGQVILQSGDIVYFYTDGVEEARSAKGEYFGLDRVVNVFRDYGYLMPEDILNTISEEVAQFLLGAQQEDDITMVCMKVD